MCKYNFSTKQTLPTPPQPQLYFTDVSFSLKYLDELFQSGNPFYSDDDEDELDLEVCFT